VKSFCEEDRDEECPSHQKVFSGR